MIFWIASYPKSGNTWIRALISAYYYSQDGLFTEQLIKKIGQFPEKVHFNDFDYNQEIVTDTTKFWIKAQDRINQDKKIKFKKTHNCLSSINGHQFTNKKNTIACIYVVRDPRNLITSLKNHYELDYEEALKFMTNEKKYIFDYHKQNDYSDFQFISSWEKNFLSWKNQNDFPIKIIKYEDLLSNTYFTFENLIKFINKILKINEGINIDKLKNSINSTSFKKLKKYEKNFGFSEAINSKINKKTIPFFYLGPDNDWKKILNKDYQDKLNTTFNKSLKFFSYI
ncbi:MAG: sulfotransferase [Pelagibacteraceae bacterium TMED267]|nr:MAG: sulfotransferase [Pelagibacteraceae bacterium TMED267]|tara:strand:- start:45 stop:893 length:849 start_codon:yes stop_codon:yes gene_type:complete